MDLQIRPSLFWDTDIQKIDLQKHKASVIERIMVNIMKIASKSITLLHKINFGVWKK